MMDNERREWIFEEEFIRFWFGVEWGEPGGRATRLGEGGRGEGGERWVEDVKGEPSREELGYKVS